MLLAAVPARVLAQVTGRAVPMAAAPGVLERADALTAEGDAGTALALLEAHLERSPEDYGARWRAARDAVALSLPGELDDAAREQLLRRAIAHADAARELRPDGIEARYWSLAAKGRLALQAGAVSASELAAAVDRESAALLALDSLHAGAHNARGKLAFELLRLPGWKRTFAYMFEGGLTRFTWEDAEAHLRRAVELEPGTILHLRDLGELLLERERFAEAEDVLSRAAALPATGAADRVFREEASKLLDRLR